MPTTLLPYEDEFTPLDIYLDTPSISIRQISVVLSSIDFMLNKTAIAISGIPVVDDFLWEELYVFGRAGSPSFYPAFVTSEVVGIQYGSISIQTKVRTLRLLRDFGVNITSGFIVAGFLYVLANPTSTGYDDLNPPYVVTSESPKPLPFVPVVDVSSSLDAMVKSLSSNGRPWTLTIKSSKEGQEVTIKGNQSKEPHGHPRKRHRQSRKIAYFESAFSDDASMKSLSSAEYIRQRAFEFAQHGIQAPKRDALRALFQPEDCRRR